MKRKKWLELNTKYSEIYTEKKEPLKDYKKYENEENKFDKYFEENI